MANSFTGSDDSNVPFELSTSEKLSLTSGASFWTVQSRHKTLVTSDGPHGIRKQHSDRSVLSSHPATCFPTACTLSCSWNTSLVHAVGAALAKEASLQGIHVLLGPGMNLKRHPAGGRNFEYWSEDPVVSALLSTHYVQGVQESGTVGACIKHYAVNNQESHRFVVNAVVDDRTLYELYVSGFLYTLQHARPCMLMAAYNRVNGIYCCAHTQLLSLAREYHEDVVVVSDWGAVHDRVGCLRAGLDLEMPGSGGAHHEALEQALEREEDENDEQDTPLSAALDNSVERLQKLIDTYVQPVYALNADSATNGSAVSPTLHEQVHRDHHKLARQAAVESIVLLRNENNFLPLDISTPHRIALIGCFATDHPRFQGMGSSKVNPAHTTTIYQALHEACGDTTEIVCCAGYTPDDDDQDDTTATTEARATLIAEAVQAAEHATIVIACVGLPEIMESEGMDREPTCRMPMQHEQLLQALPRDKTIGVLCNGGVLCGTSALEHPRALVETYLAGQAAGSAVVDILFGQATPSGKLTESWPWETKDLAAHESFPGNQETVKYQEGLMIGYRYLDTAQVPVRYPFGYGLSYTTFAYRNVDVTVVFDEEKRKHVTVEVTVQNTGEQFAGQEIVQVYVSAKDSAVFRPFHELKAFAKTRLLQPGESETLCLELTEVSFGYYDIGHAQFVVEPLSYEIQIAAGSRDIRSCSVVTLTTGEVPTTLARESYPPNHLGVDEATFQRRFAGLYQQALPPSFPNSLYHHNSMLKEVAKDRWLGKLLMHFVYQAAVLQVKSGVNEAREKRMIFATVACLPLRALVLFSEGKFPFVALDACISVMNYQFFLAMSHTFSMFTSLFKRRRG